VRILLHLATAAQAAGQWIEADAYIRRVFEYRDDPYYRRYQADIAAVEQVIASRVGRFQVVGSPEGASVRLNGRVIGQLPMTEPERVEAGNYQLEVVARGHYTLLRPQRIVGGVLTREIVELNSSRPLESSVGAEAGSLEDRPWWSERWVGWTLAGVGVASGVTAGISFAVREDKASDWNDDSRCVPQDGRTREEVCGGDYEDVKFAERIGVTTSILAVVFGGAAAVHFLSNGSGSERDAAPRELMRGGTRVSASCSPGWLGVVCEGTF
jgi:hypothetical protein